MEFESHIEEYEIDLECSLDNYALESCAIPLPGILKTN